jgi:hypothetical protein
MATSPTAAASKAPVKKTTKPVVKAEKKDPVTLVGKTVIPEPEKSKKPKKALDADKPPKSKKPKLVRDSFTIPKDEYQVIDTLKQRSAKLGQPMKKSELLRAGIKVLDSR